MTPDIEEGRRLLAAATPGPWGRSNNLVYAVEGEVHWPIVQGEAFADAEVIVWAVNNLSSILDRLEAAERLADEWSSAQAIGWLYKPHMDTVRSLGHALRRALRAEQEPE